MDRDREQYAIDILTAVTERTIKRLWITIILLIVLFVGSNCAWLWYESQFETVTTTQEVEQTTEGGDNTFVGRDYFGSAESDNDHDNPNP